MVLDMILTSTFYHLFCKCSLLIQGFNQMFNVSFLERSIRGADTQASMLKMMNEK